MIADPQAVSPFIASIIAAIRQERILSNGVFAKRFDVRVETIRRSRRIFERTK